LSKRNEVLQAIGGLLCLLVGAFLALYPARRYAERRYWVDAGSCSMDVVLVSRTDQLAQPSTGSVVLLHGLAANNIIMEYLARAFANEGLRVFVPDLAGHGRSPGPFTPENAESCAGSLLRGLAARGMIVPDRTILAGHSMGGAIALRLAERFRPAGVIAISPAPMIPAHGVIHENLLFHTLPNPTANTRILVGQYDLPGLKDDAADLAAHSPADVHYSVVPGNSHVSVLFSPTVAREAQDWAAGALSLPGRSYELPSHANLWGCALGIVGLLLIAGPFLREMVGNEAAIESDGTRNKKVVPVRAVVEVALLSVFAVHVLPYWQPLRVLHLFEGGYLASFFLIVGTGLLLLHLSMVRETMRTRTMLLFAAGFAAVLLHFLITGWFELTASGAWLTWHRWARFPLFLLSSFVFLYGLEILAGPVENARRRYAFWLSLIVVAWLALAGGVLYLRTGEILLVLLALYFAVFFLLAGLGIQLVRRNSGSAPAAALFGAILLSGFCLVLFPLS